jgi:hypothetical protein
MTRRHWVLGALGAVGATEATPPAVHPDHPRLFLRRRPWGLRGLTLETVCSRGRAFAADLGRGARPGAEFAPELAMRYIVTGEARDAEEAVRRMKAATFEGSWTTDVGDRIEAIATAYDWLCGAWPQFPAEDRAAIQEILIREARRAVENLRTGASIYHTRMYAWANGVLFAGLALHGDRQEAGEFIDYGIRFYKERLIPARRHLGGAWFNAMSYGRKYMCRSVFTMLAAWRSATGEDLWERSRSVKGNWAENMLAYLMYLLRPDHSYAGYGDFYESILWSHQGTMRLVALATAETRNPFGQGFLEEVRRRWNRDGYDLGSRWYRMFEDPRIPSRPRSELPLSRLFGRDSIGMTVMRSGWGAGDTWILFKCGDYGDDHGHFDQGHFEIFRKAPLAMDHFYWAKATRFHNTLLIRDSADPGDTGGQREFSRQNHASLKSYVADPIVRTGDILDYREQGATTYVLGDLTPAYDPSRARSVTRQVVFVERRYFVVFDTVTVTDPRYVPRFLLHYPSEPRLEGNRFAWTNGGGQLIGRTLLPQQARLTAVPVCESDLDETARRIGRKYWPPGRLVVEPAIHGSTTMHFLHVLTPSDAGDADPEFRFAEEADGFAIRLSGHRLRFGRGGHSFELSRV